MMSTGVRTHRLLWALTLTALAGGCGESAPEPGMVAVTMYDNGYSPPVVRVPVGGRVLFRNLGRNQHHALALDESWSTGASFGSLVMERGDEAVVSFEQEGVYRYYCTFHGSPLGDRGMVGVVLVGDVDESPASGDSAPAVREASGRTVRVPQDHARIQAAIDAAEPGDLILIGRGVYHESLRVTTPSLVLRGVDRNEVVLDGEGVLGNGVLVLADGVAVENMTARNYTLNGFYWTGATGYRGSYLTALDNGDYGVYAFDSSDGLLEHSYAAGSPDAGFYIGQCQPCRTVVRNVISEHNALGYSGTNAGGELYLVSSTWRRNMAGIVPNTLDTELLPPQRQTTIVGNLVLDNGNLEAPAKPIAWPAFGTGILIAGGRENRVEHNLVAGHPGHGILILPSRDRRFWIAADNVVRENRILDSGRADLAVASPGSRGNCFAGNRFASSAPPLLERLQGCEGTRPPLAWDLAPAGIALMRRRAAAAGAYPRGEVGSSPPAPPQPQMPGGAEAPVRPAIEVFEAARPDLESIELPRSPFATHVGRGQRPSLAASRLLAAVGSFLPGLLYLIWTALAIGELVRGSGRRTGAWGAWLLTVVFLPLLGAGLYLAFGSRRTRRLRLGWVAGGGALYLAILVAAVLSGLAT